MLRFLIPAFFGSWCLGLFYLSEGYENLKYSKILLDQNFIQIFMHFVFQYQNSFYLFQIKSHIVD